MRATTFHSFNSKKNPLCYSHSLPQIAIFSNRRVLSLKLASCALLTVTTQSFLLFVYSTRIKQASATCLWEMQQANEIIDWYIRHPPYYGKCQFADKDTVRYICGTSCCYDSVNRVWGTKSLLDLEALISSGKWKPLGVECALHAELVKSALALQEEYRSDWVKQHPTKVQKGRDPWATISNGHSPHSKKNPVPVPIRVRVPVPVPVPVPAFNQKKRKVTGGIPDPTPGEMAECNRLGFTKRATELSNTLDQLGPRGTLSNEGRILRWCLVLAYEARQELKGADFFDVNLIATLEERAKLAFANELSSK